MGAQVARRAPGFPGVTLPLEDSQAQERALGLPGAGGGRRRPHPPKNVGRLVLVMQSTLIGYAIAYLTNTCQI